MKDNDYVTNIFKYKKMELELKDWQKIIMEDIKKKDDRKIIWVYDEKGNAGKTTFAKYLCKNYGALYVSGKSADIKYAIAQCLEEDKEVEICIWDFPRSLENYVSYEAIEAVKNGIFFNSKYESGMCVFESPCVIIFSNFEPDYEKLSKDRWDVRKLG